MTPTPIRWLAATAAGLGLLVTGAIVAVPDGYAQPPKPEPAKGPDPGARLAGASQCSGCHVGPLSEEEEKRNPQGFGAYLKYREKGTTNFVLMNESRFWDTTDLHAKAFENIRPAYGPDKKPTNLAGQMQDILSQAPSRMDKGYRVEAAAECLTCHASVQPAGRASPLAAKRPEHFLTEGVSCEACHGDGRKWFFEHTDETWREVPGAKKQAEYGQIDLRDPYTRTLKCASCHIGNKAEGKFVTHEMYAAGHPPLPPFELVTFARDAPAHYRPPRENRELLRRAKDEPDKTWANLHYRSPDLECPDARSFAVGTVAAFEAAMQLLAEDARDTKPGELLDFAHFDCYACHHDLKHPSFRQQRGYRGVPGRPTMRPWAADTLKAVLKHAEGAAPAVTAPADAIRNGLVRLNAGFDAKPFGQPGTIAEEAGKLVEQCRLVRPELDQLIYSPERTEALYRLLADRVRRLPADGKPGPDGLYLDHDAAQQAVWGLQALQAELRHARRPGFVSDPKALDGPAGELHRVVRLRIREAKREPVAGERLKQRLEDVAAFEPGLFLPRAKEWLKAFEKK